MNTIAPQIPVKIMTALWFSILAFGIPPVHSQKKYILKTKQRKGLQIAEDSHKLPCFVAIIIPQKGRGRL